MNRVGGTSFPKRTLQSRVNRPVSFRVNAAPCTRDEPGEILVIDGGTATSKEYGSCAVEYDLVQALSWQIPISNVPACVPTLIAGGVEKLKLRFLELMIWAWND